MADVADRRAREIIEGLLEIDGIVFTTPRSKYSVIERLSDLLDEMPAKLAPPAKLLAEWLVDQPEVADLFADDEAIERVSLAAGARPRRPPAVPRVLPPKRIGGEWFADVDGDLGPGLARSGVDLGDREEPPGTEVIARIEGMLARMKSFWPEVERAFMEHVDCVEDAAELRLAIDVLIVHFRPELEPRWSIQITLEKRLYPDAAYIAFVEDWEIVEVVVAP
jgi:hypothetical protein